MTMACTGKLKMCALCTSSSLSLSWSSLSWSSLSWSSLSWSSLSRLSRLSRVSLFPVSSDDDAEERDEQESLSSEFESDPPGACSSGSAITHSSRSINAANGVSVLEGTNTVSNAHAALSSNCNDDSSHTSSPIVMAGLDELNMPVAANPALSSNRNSSFLFFKKNSHVLKYSSSSYTFTVNSSCLAKNDP